VSRELLANCSMRGLRPAVRGRVRAVRSGELAREIVGSMNGQLCMPVLVSELPANRLPPNQPLGDHLPFVFPLRPAGRGA
jgi:hypothetical protein